ncbi:outer membrane protein assembly factor BamA [Neorickettsia sennetsu]|uniref:Outer membrane protein assembly factor BamA n=1 Tax=Ehrlichia sennetsu (strain ATCC VR-367 / Miyayama) TaxID=222891 RepID=Q2GD52_EHRS3|nr:outer membrane protein assembly factor BamA [Neorickettsia sennetsu]ABD46374.1 outer membrane protein, OMP85 family [Neorickettsia sennetsu str. Miyayama]
MRKKLFLVWLLFLSRFCFADEVVEIRISGNKRVAETTIHGLLHVEVGQDVTSDELNAVFKRLTASRLFSSVELDLTAGILEVKLQENPILRNVVVKGNKLLSRAAIDKILVYKKDAIFDVHEFENSITALKTYYRDSVVEKTAISYRVVPIDENNVNVEVTVKEAKPTVIRAIEFEGNIRYSDRVLKHVIRSREKSILRLFGTAHYYSREKLEFDKDLLADFYQGKGYFDYSLEGLEERENEDGVVLVFKLKEGARYSFGRVNVVSEKSEIEISDLKEKVRIREGAVFNIGAVRENALTLLSVLNERGHMFVNVVPQYQPDADGRVDVTYYVVSTKKYRIRKINISGNIRTRDTVIRREMLLSENDLYQPSKVADSRRRILNLGFFDEVYIEERKVDDQNLILEVRVKERPTGTLNLSGGYGSDVGFFGNFSFVENNLFGTSDRLVVELQRASLGSNYSVEFQRKRIFDTFITAGASVFYKNRNEKANGLYKFSSVGGDGSVSYSLRDDLRLHLGYSLSFDRIFDVDGDAPESVKRSAGTKILSAVSYSLFLNKLDNYFVPRYGYGVRFGNKFAGIGGDVKFLRSDFKAGGFVSIFDQSAVLSLVVRAGNIFGYSGQGVDVANRFFLNEMRGFDSLGIGPRDVDTGDALGGNSFILGTAEVQVPMRLPVELDLKAAFFYEVGTLAGVDVTAEKVYDSHALRSSIGAGLVWNSPFGVLRVDVAKALIEGKGDKVKTVKFGIVSPF